MVNHTRVKQTISAQGDNATVKEGPEYRKWQSYWAQGKQLREDFLEEASPELKDEELVR